MLRANQASHTAICSVLHYSVSLPPAHSLTHTLLHYHQHILYSHSVLHALRWLAAQSPMLCSCYAQSQMLASLLMRAWRPSCTRNLVLPVHPSTVNLRIHSLLRLLAVLFTHRLRSELDACIAANARMEAELHKQSAAASTRLAELQDSYTAKVRGRQLHS